MNGHKITALLIAAVLLLAAVPIPFAAADENGNSIYVTGVNLTRGADSVIVYRGVAATGQTSLGHSVAVAADGTVTDVYGVGDAGGENLAVPEGGYVVSATGSGIQWLKDNAAKGKKLFFDRLTNRLFACDNAGYFDPGFTVQRQLREVNGEKYLVNEDGEAISLSTKCFAVNAAGEIIPGETAPEGGYLIHADGESAARFMQTHAIPGVKCTVEEDTLALYYTKSSYKRTATLAAEYAEVELKRASEAFTVFDQAEADAFIADVKERLAAVNGYAAACTLAADIYEGCAKLFSDGSAFELRSAVHTPTEGSEAEVRATLQAAQSAGLNALAINIINGYGSCIPYAGSGKYAVGSDTEGFDALKCFIECAPDYGIQIDMCMSVLYSKYAAVTCADWMTDSNKDDTVLTNRFYSPANTEFRREMAEYVGYIVSHYAVSNVILDYARYPKFSENADLGYDEATLLAFCEYAGVQMSEAEKIKTELFSSAHWSKWVEFKTKLVTDTVSELSAVIREKRGDIAIIAVAARDSVDYYYMQDVRGWISDNTVDGICLSLYNYDSAENDNVPVFTYGSGLAVQKGSFLASHVGKSGYFLVGLESGAEIPAYDIAREINGARSIGADGFILSDLTSYLAQNYPEYLCGTVMKSKALPPRAESQELEAAILDELRRFVNETVLARGGCDEAAAQRANKLLDEAAALVSGGDPLPGTAAEKLAGDLAVVFAESAAKSAVAVLADRFVKAAYLSADTDAPVIDDPEKSTDVSDNPGESSAEPTPSEQESSTSSANIPFGSDGGEKPPVGGLLGYIFVVTALAAGAVMIVIGAKRRRNSKKAPLYRRHRLQNGEETDKKDKQ